MPPKLLFLRERVGATPSFDLGDGPTTKIPRGPMTKGQERLINSKSMKLIDQYPEYLIESTNIRLFTQEDLLTFITCDTPLSMSSDSDNTNTVLDKRMGQTEKNELCLTCGRGMMDCEGHPGAIPLPFTIANPKFWVQIVASLRLVCRKCGNINVTKDILKATGLNSGGRGTSRMKQIGELAATLRKCKRCETMNFIYKNFDMIHYSTGVVSSLGVEHQRTKTDKWALLDIQDIEDIFSRTNVEQWRDLGFHNLPIDFLIKRLYVQPVCLRLREIINGNALDSPQTTFYDYVIKMIYLFSSKDSTQKEVKEFRERLYDFVHLFMTGSRRKLSKMLYMFPKITLKMIADLRSIPQALAGKGGIFRRDIMAKRTDFTSRTVIGPAWTATFNEVGMPKFFSRCHTVKFYATNRNLETARALWRSDDAMSVILGGAAGRFYKVEVKKSDKNAGYLIQPGDIIRRYVKTGDTINFNRQPTLDKFSYMTYSAVVENRKSIGLPSESTKTHNADFDGDEANILTPQNIGTIVEGRTICAAENNTIGNAGGGPKAALAYTSVTAAYLLTGPDVVLDDEDFRYAASRWMNPNGADTYAQRIARAGINPRSGSALFSIVFEPEFTFVKGGVRIENGILVSGRLTKDTSATSSRGIVDVLAKYYFPGSVANFLKLSNRLLDWYIYAVRGFTIKFRDIFPQNLEKENLANFARGRANFIINDTNLSLVHDVFNGIDVGEADGEAAVPKYLQDVRDFVNEYRSALETNEIEFGLNKEFKKSIKTIVEEKRREIEVKIAALPDPENLSITEKVVRNSKENNILNQLENIGNTLANEIFTKENPFNVMTISGSKGNQQNIAKIAGVLGQQFMDGDRPPLWCTRDAKYPDGSRCLPFFRPRGEGYVHEIKSTGYITNSFGLGLGVSEIPFHIAASRVGLIDTSLKSQVTGAFQRLMIKYLEDFVSEYDGSTKIHGRQVQFMAWNGVAPDKTMPTWSRERGSHSTSIDVDLIVAQVNAMP